MKTIGIIGGGQLGLMIAEQARILGARTICLDPAVDAPAFAVTDEHIVGRFDDPKALEELCGRADIVTYEFENVPGDLLINLENKYNIPQGFRPLFDSQDRAIEKENARNNGLRTPEYAIVDDEKTLRSAVEKIGYPCVFKTRRLGYDGHGQQVLRSDDDLGKVAQYTGIPSIVEEFVKYDYEASVVMVSDGYRIISFPIGCNIHRDGILDLCVVPAAADESVLKRMESDAKNFMRRCGYVGILAIEFFVKGEDIYFNEMAPRPHNSGHYTIEGCTTNQFRELCHFLLGMPLEEPKLIAPTVMKNILGQDLEIAKAIEKDNDKAVYVHLYGKSESRPKRKMGHITYVPMDYEQFITYWAKRFV